MRSRLLLYASVAAITLLSSGCTVLRSFGFHRAASGEQAQLAKASEAPAVPVVAAAPSDVRVGRTQLDAANYGLAIQSFRKALARGVEAAPALNGLGVAYARIGRTDLAERYFRQASAADPGSQRYADNLVVVLRVIEERQQMAQLEASFDSALHRVALASSTQDRAQQASTGKLTQVSAHNFVITSSDRSGASGRAAIARAPSSQAVPGFKPLVRIVFATKHRDQVKLVEPATQ